MSDQLPLPPTYSRVPCPCCKGSNRYEGGICPTCGGRPVWQCVAGHIIVSTEEPTRCKECDRKARLRAQDETRAELRLTRKRKAVSKQANREAAQRRAGRQFGRGPEEW
jgi:hypothetical protein